MRPDFGRCVIERERRGSSNSSAKARMIGRYVHTEDGLEYEGPSKIPVSRGRIQGYFPKLLDKDFSDVLGPVRGYLFSKVGCRWDDVYSELSQGLGKFSWPMRHILEQHVHVAIDTWRGRDGQVWHTKTTGSRSNGSGPQRVDGGWDSEFYVHPETGTLRAMRKRSWRKDWNREDIPATDRLLTTENGKSLAKVNGCWFLCTYAEAECKNEVQAAWPDYKPVWYRIRRFTKIKSANKKEIRKVLARRSE